MNIDVSIVIVGTNEKNFVIKCLDSIRHSKTRYSLETILVDNASSDGTAEAVLANYPEVILDVNSEKLGYIHNNVMASRKARGKYILLLNSDIELQPNTIEYMVNFMNEHPKCAVSSCRLLFEDGTLQLTCRQFPTPWIYLNRVPHFFRWIQSGKKFSMSPVVKQYLMLDYDHKTTRPVDWALSALFLMRKEAIEKIGELDNDLMQPFYLEDVEWCFRAWINGWKVYYIPEVFAYHFYRRDSVKKFNKMSIVHLVNIIKFFNKHGIAMMLGQHRKAQRLVPIK
jgi:GT2 family glycosyltransferase